jgi:uncharacterized protein
MAINPNYPGVYIDEFEPAAPIQGVGTAVAAFLGLNAYGPPMQPTQLTSWDAYQKAFAAPAPTAPNDDDYLYYAVRGFFQNGGQTCFVTAVSNATPDSYTLADENGNNTLVATARVSGHQATSIDVVAGASHTVTNVSLFAPDEAVVNAGGTSVELADAPTAAQFLAGDAVLVGAESKIVARTSGKLVYLNDALQANYTAASNIKLRLAPLATGITSLRVIDVAPSATASKLTVGSIITLSQGAAPTQTTVVTATRAERLSAAKTTYRISLRDGLIAGFALYGTPTVPIALQSEEFDLTVSQGATSRPYSGLSMEASNPNYFANVVNRDATGLINVQPVDPPNSSALPTNRPHEPNVQHLANGQNYDPATIKTRSSDYEAALARLAGNRDINMVATPDRTDAAVQGAVLAHCEGLFDRFAIFDSIKGVDLQGVETQRNSLESAKGFGALYYPWISVASVKTGQPILLPPSGHIAGIYARTDLTRGVFKAPAGNDCTVNGALGVEVELSDIDQGVINLKGIDVIRVFQHGGRPIVWGARTTSSDTNWQYVNIRRLFLFLEESIQVGIRGAVFEPNNPALWQKLKRTITAFLTQQWRDGALFGVKVEDAFYVRIDDVLNPDDQRALGRLTIEIGVRPSYPAEFIIVRIGIWQGGSDVTES